MANCSEEHQFTATNAVYQAEMEKMRRTYEQQLEAARQEALRKAKSPVPERAEPRREVPRRAGTWAAGETAQYTEERSYLSQERWMKAVYSETGRRNAWFGSLSVMWDQFWRPTLARGGVV